eukprot:s910_g11.t1
MFDILHATKNLGGQGDFVCLPISVPSLPTSAFDPLALAAETPAAVQGNMASLNGQVIVNFATSAVEEFMLAQREREEYKAYIEKLHEQRLAYLAAKRSDILAKRGLEMREKGSAPTMDRKPFAWRELRSDGWMCESVLNASKKLTRSLVPVGSGAMLPPSVLLHILVSFGSQVRPDPPGRWGRNAARHLCDIIEQKKEAPTLVHLVAMSVNKENGDLEAKHLLDNIQLPTPASYPSIKPRHQIRR